MASPDFLFSDRRHLAQVTSDRDGWIHSSKLMASASAEEDRTILSALGDRLALYQSLWTAQVEGAPLVVESLGLCEVDDGGRFVELLHFDLEQRREANDELWDRFQGTEEGQAIPSVVFENRRAFNDHDLVALRATLHDDLVFDDHRRTGTGELDADGYVESVAALFATPRIWSARRCIASPATTSARSSSATWSDVLVVAATSRASSSVWS